MLTDHVFPIGVGDTGPSIIEDLKQGDGTPVVLTGGSVRLRLYDSDGVLVFDRPATIVDGPNGRVRYDWQAGDTAVGGTFFRRWICTLISNQVESVPTEEGIDGYPVVIIDPSTAAAGVRLVCSPWCSPADVTACGPCRGVELDPSLVQLQINRASDLLYLLSGKQFPGICTETGLRPNRVEWFGGRLIGSVSSTGEVFGSSPPRYVDHVSDRNLGAGPISEILLPVYPIVAITRVRVDGVVLPPSAYKIDDDRWLARVDGQFWPVIQDITKNPATDLGTMDVDVQFGAPIPDIARFAAAALACQWSKACTPGAQCSLPSQTQQAVRQGLTVRKAVPLDYLDKGKTGVEEADQFLSAVNPNKIQERAVVLSPDTNWPAHRLR